MAILITFLGTGVAKAFTASEGFTASVYAGGFTPSTGPAGIVFLDATAYAVDPADGGLYRASTGASGFAMTRLSSLGGAPTGIAVAGGALYVTRVDAADVVRVDPGTGAITRTIATSAEIPCPGALAADPVTGDLFVTSCDWIWRIQDPGGVPVVSRYTQLFSGGVAMYGITISPDDTIYVAVPSRGEIWRVQGPTQAAGASPLKGPIAYAAAPRGVALVAPFLFVSGADGTITKAALPEDGSANVIALAGGDPGDLATLGPDGCFYASQGPAIVRLGDATGGCALAAAAPPPPLPSLTLLNTSTATPLVGAGDQTFTATLTDVPTLGGVSVTFTVTGANPLTRTTTTSPNGVTAFAYSATNIGTDTVIATAMVDGAPVTSNALTVAWPRAFDAAAPSIGYSVSGTHGGSFGCPRADIGWPGVTEYCGWFVSPPTITWAVIANGPSGIDATRTSCPAFTLVGTSPITGTPVTCIAYNGDGASASLQVVLQATGTPPTVTAIATTADGATYLAGSLTTQAVTVTFLCDSAYGQAGVAGCTPPATVSASGSTTVSGSVVDIAGIVRTTSFGPIVIDRAGPVIHATALSLGAPYVYGAPTVADVTLTFSCEDVPAGVASCPADVTVTALGTSSATVTATDTLGNVTTATFGPIVIDRTGPVAIASLSPVPDRDGNVALSGTVTMTATDPSGVASITYWADGAQTLSATTVAGALAHATITAIGTTTVSFFATDPLGNAGAVGTFDVHVISTQPSSLRIVSSAFLATGSATVRARLVGTDGATPAVGKPVTFTAGGSSATALTDAAGIATAALPLAVARYELKASFAGDAAYFASRATEWVTIFAPDRFVVWGPNATPGARVQFYGAQWAKQIADVQARRTLDDFKGYAATVDGTSWTAGPGDKVKAPQRVAEYIGVLVTTSATSSGHQTAGNIVAIAVLRVDDYTGKLGGDATGIIVGLLPAR